MVARTTIQIDPETLRLLAQMKQAEGARSYAELLRGLVRRSRRAARRERGSLPKLKEFRREKHDRLD